MYRKPLLLFILLFAFTFVSQGQSRQDSIGTNQSSTIFTKKNAVIAGLALQQIGSFYIEYKWWWEGNYHPFVIYSDGWFNNYSLGMDKVGHFYISYMYFHSINELMKWAEFSNKSRLWTAITLPSLYALSIEIGDGFSSFNFSTQDLITNLAGVGYGVLQDKVPYLQNINFKMSYLPSPRFSHNGYKGWSLTEDYDGHLYWATFNVNGMLPERLKKFWPEFLNIGLGYGIDGFGSTQISREYVIGFDYNLRAIKLKSKGLNLVRNIVDKFHFPAPGLKKDEGESFKPYPFILR